MCFYPQGESTYIRKPFSDMGLASIKNTRLFRALFEITMPGITERFHP